jgi:hypothetical protein
MFNQFMHLFGEFSLNLFSSSFLFISFFSYLSPSSLYSFLLFSIRVSNKEMIVGEKGGSGIERRKGETGARERRDPILFSFSSSFSFSVLLFCLSPERERETRKREIARERVNQRGRAERGILPERKNPDPISGKQRRDFRWIVGRLSKG